ncbi:MAG: type I restriction enzyme HsdR N-terminal domain-containing protein [Sphingomonadales bacterium]
MIELHYPARLPKTRVSGDAKEVFDPVRKRWVRLSPEEWIRQLFILLLTETHRFPTAWMAVEQSITLGALQKRFDLLVYDSGQQPWMMIECKAETVALDEGVLDQLLRYNMSVPVRYLLITNGSSCMGWERSGQTLIPLQKIPAISV